MNGKKNRGEYGSRLDYGLTVRVGFAFLSITAFWQMYNNVIPLMLTNTFQMNETFSGMIMAADNVLALFLLPLFGGLSDRCSLKLGKRRPFILGGSAAAMFLMLLIPYLDNRYFSAPSDLLKVLFVCVLGCLLVAMGTYRSPAVALMPDVTPKPLRSRGNAIINLMGALGGVLYLVIASILYSASRTEGMEHVDYFPLFLVIAGIMVISLIIVMTTVHEAAEAEKMRAYEAQHPEEDLSQADEGGSRILPAAVKRSLGFLLFSVAFWFIGYNAVETWFTTFAGKIWDMSLGQASQCLTIATGGAIVSYLPVAHIAGKAGRRKTILGGIILLCASFLAVFVYSCFADTFHPALYAVFLAVGAAWAAINVNSLPMVLEMCRGSEIGRFTGFYYTFSMAAQILTPILTGFLMNHISYRVLFPYAAIFSALSFATMCMVRHGDSRAVPAKGIEVFDTDL